jgi:hypothetical protein
MTTPLEVRRLVHTSKRWGRALCGGERERGVYHSASSYTRLCLQRLTVDSSDAAGVFVESAEATRCGNRWLRRLPLFARWARQFLPVGFTLRLA